MNTEMHILKSKLNFDINEMELPILDEEEQLCIGTYVELTRHIQEIDKLFHIFRFNLKNILQCYQLYSNNEIDRKELFEIKEEDEIAINALIINYISSAKTLIESIENCIKNTNLNIYKDFKDKCLSKSYDNKFYYRFLIRLRDFAQHGHLIVSVYGNNYCCFDLDNIVLTPHFHHNTNLEKELRKMRKEIKSKYDNYPRIVFTRALGEFNMAVTEIYFKFIDIIERVLGKSINELKSLINKRPDIIYKSTNCFNGYIVYDYYEESIHCFNPNGDAMKMLLEFKTELIEIIKKEEKEFELCFNEKYSFL